VVKRPELGDTVRVTDMYDQVHICTVVDLLSAQFRATYEVAREDGGWVERTVFSLYNGQWEPVK
jgi:hypothetical protein